MDASEVERGRAAIRPGVANASAERVDQVFFQGERSVTLAARRGFRASSHAIRVSRLLTVVRLELSQSVLEVRELGGGHHVRKHGP